MWWLYACTPAVPEVPERAETVERATPARGAPAPFEAPQPVGEVSGAALQDPTGFPRFHSRNAPPGPAPHEAGAWSAPVRLSVAEGGLRPQIASGPDGSLHVVYYAQTERGDLLRHRVASPVGACRAGAACAWSDFSAPVEFGESSGRNWGPDLVVRADGSAVVSWDHSDPAVSFAGRVMLSTLERGVWSEPLALTEAGQVEVGSAHVADAGATDLAVVWIQRLLQPGAPFVAFSRWRVNGTWGMAAPLPSPDTASNAPVREAWHTNVERRPDGGVVAGWDLGPGGGQNQVLFSAGRGGVWEAPTDASAGQFWGERPHFAFLGASVFSAWFHRVDDQPLRVYVRDPDGAVTTLSGGLGGFNFDPDIAVNADGVRVAVWGWDSGADADLVYSLNRGQGWSRAARVARLPDRKPGLPSLTVTPDGAFHVVWAHWVRGVSDVYYAHLTP